MVAGVIKHLYVCLQGPLLSSHEAVALGKI